MESLAARRVMTLSVTTAQEEAGQEPSHNATETSCWCSYTPSPCVCVCVCVCVEGGVAVWGKMVSSRENFAFFPSVFTDVSVYKTLEI